MQERILISMPWISLFLFSSQKPLLLLHSFAIKVVEKPVLFLHSFHSCLLSSHYAPDIILGSLPWLSNDSPTTFGHSQPLLYSDHLEFSAHLPPSSCLRIQSFLLPLLLRRQLISDSSCPHGLQHPKPSYPLPSPRVCPSSCPLHRWCHPTISSCHPLLLLPSIFPSTRVFSSESAVCIRWPKYWSFSFNISLSNIQG